MKNLFQILIFCFCLVLVWGCDNETDNISFITSYPTFNVVGGTAISVVQGSAFIDPGVNATEDGQDIEVSASGSVDTAVPGLYRLNYSATNSDGYSATVTRFVAVVGEGVEETDISGTYYRAANSRQSVVTRLAPGFYFMTDVWGSATSGTSPLPVNSYLIHTGGDNLTFRYNESGAPFGGNQGTGTILEGKISLTVTLIGVSATRTNEWIKM